MNTPFQCQLCENKPFFARRDSLRRHIECKHGDSPAFFECAHCCKTFSLKQSLFRHITALHLGAIDTNEFYECVHCSKKFRLKHSLFRHITALHLNASDDKDVFECVHCSRTFLSKHSLLRHIAALHIDPKCDEYFFECVHCSKIFDSKNDIQTHVATMHPDAVNDRRIIKSRFKCLKCTNEDHFYSSKHSLNRHMRSMHGDPMKFFECSHCSTIFKRKDQLSHHIRQVHVKQKQKIRQSRSRCLKCSSVFCSTSVLNRHYVDTHGVQLDYEKLEFDSMERFKQWLEYHQHQTSTRFRIWYSKNSIQRLICHRSKGYRSPVPVDNRKRSLKISGYKGLGGVCPAEMRVRIREDGTCCVDYQKTHVGHNVGDESELKHIFLTDEEKKKIAAEIQNGVPLSQIVKSKRVLKPSDPDNSRLSLVTMRDVRNIAVSQRFCPVNRAYVEADGDALDTKASIAVKDDVVVFKERTEEGARLDVRVVEKTESRAESVERGGGDAADVQALIAAHQDDIAYYKRPSEADTRFDVLERDDFALVIITETQEKYLRAHGHKVVSLDRVSDVRPHGYVLHTLLVFDNDEEELPAAFCLANRGDQCVVDIFLACVRDRVGGVLEPHTLITDMRPTYWNSWVVIMGESANLLFCTWHVYEAWRKNFGKILDKKKRADVKAELLHLSRELDAATFENGLAAFLARDDNDLIEFQNYFGDNFCSNVEQWAYCYRTVARASINTAIESFHRKLKYNLADIKRVRSLSQCLVHIFNLSTFLEANTLERSIRGRITDKLRTLRSRHQAASQQYQKDELSSVMAINNDTFIVQSFGKTDQVYTISRHEVKECVRENDENAASESCKLVCDWCNLCFHAFYCTCEDSSLRMNMCKHIHMVGLYLKNQSPEADAITIQYSDDDEIDVSVSYMRSDENISLINIEDLVLVEGKEGADEERQKLIEHIKQQMEELQEKLDTFSSSSLQSLYINLKSLIDELERETVENCR